VVQRKLGEERRILRGSPPIFENIALLKLKWGGVLNQQGTTLKLMLFERWKEKAIEDNPEIRKGIPGT